MHVTDVDYRADTVNLRGYLVDGENGSGQRPGVLVFHEELGLGDFALMRTRKLAELGYVALAADMFGDRRQAHNLRRHGGARARARQSRSQGRHQFPQGADDQPACGPGTVKSSVLVLSGADDPLAPPERVAAFEEEMRAANVRD
jgi:dienelactone hydrolase